MKSLSDGGVGERGRRLGGELVALRGEHGQRSAAQAGMVLQGRREGQKGLVTQWAISGGARGAWFPHNLELDIPLSELS